MAATVLKNTVPRKAPQSREVVTKVFNEAGLLIKERKASWHTSCKESQKREEYIWTQTEELRCQSKVDTITRTDLTDSLRQLKKIRDEGILEEQNKLREEEEEEVWNMFEQHMGAHHEEH